LSLLTKASLIFWDFDGVIKDSLDAKTQAFVNLFKSFGENVSENVRHHHITNGGMSRFEKIPLYLEWSGQEPTKKLIDEYCEKFSKLTTQEVIDAPWVSGVEEFLRQNQFNQEFILVTATPQQDIEYILEQLDLKGVFLSVYGAPVKKRNAIKEILSLKDLKPEATLMIGDAIADLEAAQTNAVPFLLRKHSLNEEVFKGYTGNFIDNFSDI